MIRFEQQIPPVEELMKFEGVYPAGLQFDLEEKRGTLAEQGLIGVWMWLDGEMIGETYGIPDDEEESAIYCWSTTVLKPSLGLGTILKAYWLGLVSMVYEEVTGHARPGASQALQLKFGAVFDKDELDWFGTGETYKHYRIKL